jgi:hypothetical protein
MSGIGGADWGAQMLNAVATQTLKHMFTAVERLAVDIRCQPPSKLLQGALDGFRVEGAGLTIRREFRTESMMFETDAVAVDFGSALQGRLALKQPTQAIAQVVLTEADINRAFQAALVTQHLEGVTDPALTAAAGGGPISFREVAMTLLPQTRVAIRAIAVLADGSAVPVALTARVEVERRRRLRFADCAFDGDAIAATESPENLATLGDRPAKLSAALGEILDRMVDLDRFDLDGVTMRINRLETQGKTLVFAGYAQIERLPQV